MSSFELGGINFSISRALDEYELNNQVKKIKISCPYCGYSCFHIDLGGELILFKCSYCPSEFVMTKERARYLRIMR